MRNALFTILVVLFFTCFSGTVRSANNPSVRSTVGSGTVPPSSTRSGLIRSPNPIDTSSNRVITGNVGGGKHFRGDVPYNAVSDFGGRLGSSSLDSFVRRSAGSGSFYRYSPRYKPFYSPSGSVTTTRPGYSGVFRPATVRLKRSAVDEFSLSTLPKTQVLPGLDARILDGGFRNSEPYLQENLYGSRFQTQNSAVVVRRPMSMSLQELEKVVTEEVSRYSQGRKLTAGQYKEQVEQFKRDLKQANNKAAEFKQTLLQESDSSLLSYKNKPMANVAQPFELQRLREQTSKKTTQMQKNAFHVPDSQFDVYEQMQQQIESFPQSLEQLAAAKQTKETADDKEQAVKDVPHFEGYQIQESKFSIPAITRKTGIEESSQKETFALEGLTDTELSVRVRDFMGTHKTFASFSKDKFNQHIRAAEEYLRQGRYYRAADAYTLASIYKPSDPLAYAGKSHALFAAGEYMSSALFLSRALEIFPEYARFKIDIEAMVGDKDTLESRIADVEKWYEKSGKSELQFLLGYVCYHIGRIDRAKKAIDAAYEKMPESPAVIALRQAINDAIGL